MRDISFGKLFGIKLELHSTFVWLFVLMAVFLAIFQPQTVLQSMILLFFLFLSVFLHELSHSIVAIKIGIKVKKIILLPIGGVSITEEIPETPKKEFFMAIAGPLFNFAMVFLILFTVAVFPQLPFPRDFLNSVAGSGTFSPEEFESIVLSFPLFGLLWVNFMLGAFNLFVPALPMDGGRVARSILSIKFGFRKATHVMAKVSIFLQHCLHWLDFLEGILS